MRTPKPLTSELALVIGLAFAVRLLFAFAFTGPLYTDGYLQIADNLVEHAQYSATDHGPEVDTDLRLPAYPAVLATARFLSSTEAAVFVVNALLGVLSVVLIHLTLVALGASARARWLAVVAAMLYLPAATMTGSGRVENLAIPVVCALTLGLVWSLNARPGAAPLVGVAGAVAVLTRIELLPFALVCAVVVGRRLSWRRTALAVMILPIMLASGGWMLRNVLEFGRAEMVDPDYTWAAMLVSVDNSLENPLHVRGLDLGVDARTPDPVSKEYRSDVIDAMRTRLREEPVAVVYTRLKSEALFPFPAPILETAYHADVLDLSNAMRVGSAQSVIRVLWFALTLVQYALVLVFALDQRRRSRKDVPLSLLAFPIYLLVMGLVIHNEMRVFIPASYVLLVPAAFGLDSLIDRRRSGATA